MSQQLVAAGETVLDVPRRWRHGLEMRTVP